jgi:hypothetical protein
MVIKKKTTKSGVVIRYIFDDELEYQMYITTLKEIKDTVSAEYRDYVEDLVVLFEKNHKEEDPYFDNKTTATIFENYLPTFMKANYYIIESLSYKL